jgi:hypothetical protein
LQQLYNIPSEPTQPAPNVLAVSGFSNVFTNKRDLKVGYLSCLVLDLALPIYQVFLEEFHPHMNLNTKKGAA